MGLHFGSGLGARAIGRELGMSHSTVREYLARIAAAGVTWPLAPDITDTALEQKLFANGGVQAGARRHVEPDWAAVARELKRPSVTLQILWEEYSGAQPDAYSYSRYCQLYREFARRLTPSMRQTHVAGDKAFVDYSGKKVPIHDPRSGEVRHAEIFVAVLGASSLTYAEATWTQTLPDWIGAHVRMFKFWGAVPRLLVPDNLKAGVHKASFYDPEVNRSYGAMAEHYRVGILPARPYRPKDKTMASYCTLFEVWYGDGLQSGWTGSPEVWPEPSVGRLERRLRLSPWRPPSIAGCAGTTGRTVRITHQFHPLVGHEFALVCRHLDWGEDRVVYLSAEGRLRSIAARLTDVELRRSARRISANSTPC